MGHALALLLLSCALRIGHLQGAAAHKASLWVTPADGAVPVGQPVSLRCLCQVPCARLFLYRAASPVRVRHAEAQGQEARFPIAHAGPGDAGRYRCRYLSKGWRPQWSELSDPVQLVVGGASPASSPTSPPESPTPTSPPESPTPTPTSPPEPFTPTSPAVPGHSHSSSVAPTSPALPDFTYGNLIRLGLGAGVLLALGLILAQSCRSRKEKGGPSTRASCALLDPMSPRREDAPHPPSKGDPEVTKGGGLAKLATGQKTDSCRSTLSNAKQLTLENVIPTVHAKRWGV